MQRTIGTESEDIENRAETENPIANTPRGMSDHEVNSLQAYPSRPRKLLGKSGQ